MQYTLFSIVVIFYLTIFAMYKLLPKQWSLSKKVLIGLIIGLVFGIILKLFISSFLFNPSSQRYLLEKSEEWFNIVGQGYVILLQMVVIPLVLISILSAITKFHQTNSLGKIASISIGLLLLTTAIAALVGIFYALIFHLKAGNLIQGVHETNRLILLQNNYVNQVTNISIPEWILNILPKNPFFELTGARATSMISIVIFSTLLGIAALAVRKADEEKGRLLLNGIDILQTWVMKLLHLILQLTPYGVMALMVSVITNSNLNDIMQLANFLIASYLALISMYFIHSILLLITKVSPLNVFKKTLPVLIFAFTSRSSAACIPMNIETQTDKLGVPQSIASFVSTFGTSIGQNGCAGIYPAMLAVMTAPTSGINPFDPLWIISLVVVVTISSIGVAGVGGGATFAALIVLTTLNLPITIAALLISIEPLIDMGRTAININGTMTTGILTSKILNMWNQNIFNQSKS